MKLRKLIVVMITVVTLFVFSCGNVFAVCSSTPFVKPILSVGSDGVGSIGTLKSSLLDAKSRDFLLDFNKNSDDYIVAVTTSISTVCIFKIVSSGAPSITMDSNISNKNVYFKYLTINSVSFDTKTGEPVKKDVQLKATTNYFVTSTYGSTAFSLNCFVQYVPLAHYKLTKQSGHFWIWDAAYNAPDGRVKFVFDDIGNEPEPPVSSEPEPPVSSEPEPPVSSEPEPPVSSEPEPPVSSEPESPVSSEPVKPPPINEDYLGISPNVVTDIFSYFRSVIGTSTNTGIIVFFYILGIFVTIAIIRHLLD